ncbi:MAG: iron-sulfur cluster assembly protein [Candidatus Bathyarchaeia archaeon]
MSSIDGKEVWEKLKEVVDPEFGEPIVERNLIDEVKIEGSKVLVKYHLTVPFCPLIFAIHIGKEIKRKVREVQGVKDVEVIVQNHIQSDIINEVLKK